MYNCSGLAIIIVDKVTLYIQENEENDNHDEASEGSNTMQELMRLQ